MGTPHFIGHNRFEHLHDVQNRRRNLDVYVSTNGLDWHAVYHVLQLILILVVSVLVCTHTHLDLCAPGTY